MIKVFLQTLYFLIGMFYFFVLLAHNFDVYLGMGAGGAGVNRRFQSIEHNEGDILQKNEIVKEEKPTAHGPAVRGLCGIACDFKRRFFTGLEGYMGQQFIENDYLEVGFFGGARFVLGMYLPRDMGIRVGLGVDRALHVSKRINAFIETDSDYGILKFSHTAPCVNLAWFKKSKNLMFRIDGEMLFPKNTNTPPSRIIMTHPVLGAVEGHTPYGKITYRNIQWRGFISLVLYS